MHTHTQKPNEASLHWCQFKASPVAPRKPLPPRVCLSEDTRFRRPHSTQVDCPVLWQLHVMGLKIIWTRVAGEESFLMAAGLHNHTYWVTFSHGTQGSNPYYLFLEVLREESTTLVLQLHQFLNMSLLKGLASSPKPHCPEQRGHGGDSHQEGTLWLGPGSAAVSWDGCWVPSSFHPSSADRRMFTTRWPSPTRLASCCPGDSPSQHAATQWFLNFRKSKLRQT